MTLSVPIVAPYIWYQKEKVEIHLEVKLLVNSALDPVKPDEASVYI